YTRYINPLGPESASGGSVNGVVSIGNRVVNPGDWIIGDDDGLVCLTDDHLEKLIESAEAKLALEEKWISELTAGRPMAEVFGFK
ncbi:MAG: dimethylmenaquinone methyltransferase, partial [Pseudomonadota bacterium]